MAPKRIAEDETESKAPKNKRHRPSRTDPSSGQRGAFGDLGDATTAPAGDSDLDCEDDSEALAYLRSVRIQASTIPHVLAAKKAGPSLPPGISGEHDEDDQNQYADRSLYEDGVGDFRGYYEDGAYVAAPDNDWARDEDEDEEEEGEHGREEEEEARDEEYSEDEQDEPKNSSADEIRDSYFASITSQYLSLRKRLQATPPRSALDALPATNPTEVGAWKRGADTFQQWEGRLRGTDPLPAQVAAMHKESVFRLLRLLARRFLRTGTTPHERTSRWIWALLARLPDKGELDYMEVGWIRELGKKAVLLMVSLTELEVLREHYEVAGSTPEEQDEYEVGADVDGCFSDAPSQHAPLDAANAPTPEATHEHTEHISKAKSIIGSNSPTAGPSNDPTQRTDRDGTSDVEMQLDSDTEDGEVEDESPPLPHSDLMTDIETARARLLSQLDGAVTDHHITSAMPVTHISTAEDLTTQAIIGVAGVEQVEGEYEADGDEDEEGPDDERYHEPDRDLVNERVTLNMILTVAGEFYGQRDLLEFRNPFGGL